MPNISTMAHKDEAHGPIESFSQEMAPDPSKITTAIHNTEEKGTAQGGQGSTIKSPGTLLKSSEGGMMDPSLAQTPADYLQAAMRPSDKQRAKQASRHDARGSG